MFTGRAAMGQARGSRSIIDPVLRQINDLSLTFQEFSFSFVSRNCNKVANFLAKCRFRPRMVRRRGMRACMTPDCFRGFGQLINARQASNKKKRLKDY